MAQPNMKTFDVDTTGLSSNLSESERKRKTFKSRLGWAEPTFCVSCSKPYGFASKDSAAIVLCRDCQAVYSLPLEQVENVGIFCELCRVAQVSIPRDMIGKVIYYCEPCEIKMESKPPLEEMTPEDEIIYGVKRIK